MEEHVDFRDLTDSVSPITTLFGLSNFALIVFAIWSKIDPYGLIYSIFLGLTVFFSITILRNARKHQQPIRSGSVFFFVLIWLGITSFSDTTKTVMFSQLNAYLGLELIPQSAILSIVQINCLFVLPLAVYWIFPYNKDNFFGLREVSEKDVIKSIWKVAIIIILLIKIFNLPTYSEFLVIIPLIIEPVSLYNKSKSELPLLTLHINQELLNKFAVPLSMIKGVGLIMIAFIFELLDGNLWLLVILLYLAAGFVWFLDFIIPDAMKNQGKSSDGFDDFQKMMNQKFANNDKSTSKRQNRQRRRKVKKENELDSRDTEQSGVISNKIDIEGEVLEDQIIPVAKSKVDEIMDPIPKDARIGTKAHALGRKVRTELQKPQYNLNHILSTLSKEDFRSAFRVPSDNLIFDSKEGNWSPPKDLILFPIELEKYDYRRTGEILLLGFNRPIEDKYAKFNIQFNNDSKYITKLSGNQIQIGDTVFNMKTLVLTNEQWEETKISLDIVEDVDDISYTGFNTLHDLQDKLITISDKWLEFRKKAEEAAINFLAGLLGSKDPVFLGKEEIQNLLEAGDDYEIQDSGEEN